MLAPRDAGGDRSRPRFLQRLSVSDRDHLSRPQAELPHRGGPDHFLRAQLRPVENRFRHHLRSAARRDPVAVETASLSARAPAMNRCGRESWPLPTWIASSPTQSETNYLAARLPGVIRLRLKRL